MPRNQKSFVNKPEIYRIYSRQRMGTDAQTKELTKETYTNHCFSSKTSAIGWIKQQNDHGLIYVIRNRNEEMIHSYGWKANRKVWDIINRSGYYGGYKIGEPIENNFCSCCAKICADPDHPCVKNSSY